LVLVLSGLNLAHREKHCQQGMAMTLKTDPTIAATRSGAVLPVVAHPHGELLTVNVSRNPLLRDVLGPGVHFKPLRLDLEAGCWVILTVLSPGAKMPVHYHTGPAEAVNLNEAPSSGIY